MMIQKRSVFVHIQLFLLLSLSCFVFGGHGRQEDALQRLFMKKLNRTGLNGLNTLNTQELYNQDTEIFNGAHVYSQEGLKEQDKIKMLPGQPSVSFSQYGGYVTVDKSHGRALYYYFVEAVNQTDKTPLLLWLNGGPGCSSLGYGAFEENGPFRVYSDGKSLYKNPYSWNNVANVLYLESPAGVGYSYSNTTSDYSQSGDQKTASDNYLFLINWLERFPEYKTRKFYISGESYAGHYVPQLAHVILQGNRNAKKTVINLKGIIFGNAVINDETDAKGMYQFFWNRDLISDKANYLIQKYCDFSSNAPSSQCSAGLTEANADTNDLDIYNIYAPLCFSSNVTKKPKKASITNFDPCSDIYVYNYLNLPDVQEALHANVTHLDHDWEPCSNLISSWTDSATTTLPILREAMADGLRVWAYSGDIDGRVPVTSTKLSLNKLNLTVKVPWYPWYVDNEIGGYTFVYRGDLTFATVRGAGHEVPSYQAKRGLSLIQYFLSGKRLPVGS